MKTVTKHLVVCQCNPCKAYRVAERMKGLSRYSETIRSAVKRTKLKKPRKTLSSFELWCHKERRHPIYNGAKFRRHLLEKIKTDGRLRRKVIGLLHQLDLIFVAKAGKITLRSVSRPAAVLAHWATWKG